MSEEIDRLNKEVKFLRREITHLNEVLARKNQQLDALHFVWCDGGCPSGVHRYSDVRLTKEMIEAAERNTKRMRSWYNTVKWRLGVFPTMSEWHKKYAERAAGRTDLIEEQVD